MDNEKKYFRDIKMALRQLSTLGVPVTPIINAVMTVESELPESEDERIRKHIIKILDSLAACHWDGNEKAKCIAYLEKQKEQQPAEWSEEDEEMLDAMIDIVSNSLYEPLCPREGMLTWLKSLRPQPKQEWSDEEAKKAAEDYADEFLGMMHENDGSTIEDYDKPYNDFLAGVLWAKHRGIFQNGNTHCKPSEEQKKETFDGADIGYGLETAIDILENGFMHYQTDDGEYKRKQALDVLIFLLNETRKKEDTKLWSKDIVESIVTWATEKLQLYSMKESTPYVEAVKNNAQKVLDWAKEQWPIYFGWKPSEEQIYSLGTVVKGYNECTVGSVGYHLKEMYEQLKKLM